MQTSRLGQVFEKLSLKDLRELKKRVNSPAFNQRDHVAKLFTYLSETERERESTFDYSSANKIVFPNQKLDNARLRNSMTLLLQIIENYLADKFSEEPANRSIALAKAYRQLRLPKHYDQTVTKAQKMQRETGFRSAEFYLQNYMLEYERYQFLSEQRRLTDINLQTLSDDLDIAYLALKLRQTCFSLSHQAVYKTNYDFGLLPLFLKAAESEPYSKVPAIKVYYYCYLSLTDFTDESHFRKFKELLIHHSKPFPLREIRDLFLLAANYCNRRINDGFSEFALESLDIYREGLDKGYLLSDKGELSRFTYSNIITNSLVAQEYDWAKDFSGRFREKLSPKHRESTYSYNLARLEFESGNLESALPLLQKTEYKELVLNLTAKVLIAKIYFETDEYEALSAHLDAVRQFIRRKKVIGYHRDMFRNFVSVLKKRIEIPNFEKEKLNILKKEAEALNPTAEKRWLLTALF